MSEPVQKRQRLIKGSNRASPLPPPTPTIPIPEQRRAKKEGGAETLQRSDFNVEPVVWPRDDPFDMVGENAFMFSCSRGTETFILGDTIEILEISDGKKPRVHIGEIEAFVQNQKTMQNTVNVRWIYAWNDIRNNVKDSDYKDTIPLAKLDPSCREVFRTRLIQSVKLEVPLRKCYLLPRPVYESHKSLGEHSPYYGRPVYSILGTYNVDTHKFGKLDTKASLHDEVLNNRFYMVVHLVSVLHVDVNARNDVLSTALHHAAQFGNTDILRFLIANGANVNLKDAEGFTPMHWAANEGYTATDSLEPMKILYEAGAAIDPVDLTGKTPLMWAEEGEDEEIVKFIRKKLKERDSHERESTGDDVDFRDDMDDELPGGEDTESILQRASSQQTFQFAQFTDDTPLSEMVRLRKPRSPSPPRPHSPPSSSSSLPKTQPLLSITSPAPPQVPTKLAATSSIPPVPPVPPEPRPHVEAILKNSSSFPSTTPDPPISPTSQRIPQPLPPSTATPPATIQQPPIPPISQPLTLPTATPPPSIQQPSASLTPQTASQPFTIPSGEPHLSITSPRTPSSLPLPPGKTPSFPLVPPEKPKLYLLAYKSLPKQHPPPSFPPPPPPPLPLPPSEPTKKRVHSYPPGLMDVYISLVPIPLEMQYKRNRRITSPTTSAPTPKSLPPPPASTPMPIRTPAATSTPPPSSSTSISPSQSAPLNKSASSSLEKMLAGPSAQPKVAAPTRPNSSIPKPPTSAKSIPSTTSTTNSTTPSITYTIPKLLNTTSKHPPTSKPPPPAKPPAKTFESCAVIKPPALFKRSPLSKPPALPAESSALSSKPPAPSFKLPLASSSTPLPSSVPRQPMKPPTTKSTAKLPFSTPSSAPSTIPSITPSSTPSAISSTPSATTSSSKHTFVIPCNLSKPAAASAGKFTPTPIPASPLLKRKDPSFKIPKRPPPSGPVSSFLDPPVSEISIKQATSLGKREHRREEEVKRNRGGIGKYKGGASPENELVRGRGRGRDVASPDGVDMERGNFDEMEREDEYRHDTTQKELFSKVVSSDLLVEVPPNSQEFGNVNAYMKRCGNGSIKRRETFFEMHRAWRINNRKFEQSVLDNSRGMGGYVRVFHGTSPESFLNIAREGFRLPSSLMNNDGKGPLFFGRMIYFAVEPGNSLYYSSNHPYLIIADVFPGKCWKHESRVPRLQPETLHAYKFDSIYSETVSTRGKIWAIPDPLQVIPRYLVKLRKVQQDSLFLSVQAHHRLPKRTFRDRPPLDVRGAMGVVHVSDDFVTLWDVRPSFLIHCLVVYRKEHNVPPFREDSIPILEKMDEYIEFLLKEFTQANAGRGFQFKYGIGSNPTQRQLHCHLYSPNKKSAKQARNVLFKKFLPPVIKTPKQVISLIRKYKEYDGTDDVAPPLAHITDSSALSASMEWLPTVPLLPPPLPPQRF